MSRRRKWLFRALAVLFGLSLFAIAEGVCFLAGWGKPTDYPDPYVGFSKIHPLFVKDDAGEKYIVPRSRHGYFQRQSFPVEKGPDTFRIFCFGGSTVWGRPFAAPTAFPKWLELSLTAGDSRRTWEVINCGGVSYASYRLAPIVKECRGYRPDLFILCTGHNEFLEERTYEHIKHAPRILSVPAKAVSRLRTVTLLRQAINGVTGRGPVISEDRPELKSEVEALLDFHNGLKAYHRDEKLRKRVVEHFEFNLRRMIDLARNGNVPVILILPPSDLRDTPPFKSEHRAGISADELAKWKSLIDRARALYRADLERAAALLEQAREIDGEYAAAVYELGRCYDALWQRTREDEWPAKARAAYIAARDLDVCPLRMISPLEEAMRRVARETGVPFIDAGALLEAECPGNILDGTFLVDHIHPAPFAGHQRLAQAIAQRMREHGWFQPGGDWETKRTAAYRAHGKSLPDVYYVKGRDRLAALRAWAKGRADGPPIESRKKNRRKKRATP